MTPARPIPPYQQAVSLILRICGPLFRAACEVPGGPTPGEPNFEAWADLRHIASEYLWKRSTLLGAENSERLLRALKFAHEAAHLHPKDCEILFNVDRCPCHVAELLRELAQVLAEAKLEEGAAA